MSGTLFVVATPIGNRDDLSPRAREVLERADRVLCEDTRRTGRFLREIGITTRLESHHEHNERAKTAALVEDLARGATLALVSDAGTPTISDPGFPLVRAARAAGVPVVPVPGPNAALAALSVSGLPTDRFLFLGYLPPRIARRRALLEGVRELGATLIFYESPHRITKTLAFLVEVLGNRDAALCRELTKRYEETITAPLEHLTRIATERDLRGEMTLVVDGAPRRAARRRRRTEAEEDETP